MTEPQIALETMTILTFNDWAPDNIRDYDNSDIGWSNLRLH